MQEKVQVDAQSPQKGSGSSKQAWRGKLPSIISGPIEGEFQILSGLSVPLALRRRPPYV